MIGLQGYGEDVIGLEAADGTRIRITADEARQLKTVDHLLEDAGPEDYVILPKQIDGELLQKIETFLKTGSVDTSDRLLDLLKAANYLEFTRLIYHLLPEWVNNPALFPGPAELKGLVPEALYFYWGTIADLNNVDESLKRPFQLFTSTYGANRWNIRFAAERGNLNAVERLLQMKWVNPAASNNFAVRWAARNGHLPVVERLLQDARVNPGANRNDAIQMAAARGHEHVVDRLLQDARVDPSAQDNRAIIKAAVNGEANVVRRLLRDVRVDPTAQNNAALLYAAEYGHLNVVQLLLQDERVDPSASNNEAIKVAARMGHLAVVNFLLQDKRVDPTAANSFALRWAARKGHLDIVERLLQDGRVDPEFLRNFFDQDVRIRELYSKYSGKKE